MQIQKGVDEDGEPVVQKSSDPFPGYFISASALEDNTKGKYDPRRYVDSAKIPYIVLPGNQLIRDTGARLGDFAAVYNGNNGKFSYAICADIGPSQKIGEGSIALAQALGHNPFVRGKVQVGIDDDVLYVVFPRSQNASKAWSSEWSVDDVNKQAEKHFINWCGMQRIQACLTELR